MEKFAYKTWALVGLSLLSFHAGAAGLGKLSVLSALGEPLRAEIEIVSVQKSESGSLSAKLATAEAYRQVNVEMSAVLMTLKFEVEVRPNGQHVIKITSPGPVADPFVDMLVELNWSSGRLVREYTFLLDPPGYQGTIARQSTPPAGAATPPVQEETVPPAEAARLPAVPLPAITEPQEGKLQQQAAEEQKATPDASAKEAPVEAASAERAAPAREQPLTETPQAPSVAPEAAKAVAVHEVKSGHTLGKIANQNRIEGVTFQQMLVALFRANEDAFIRQNMNRVRAGKILSIPDKDVAASVSVEEARSIVSAQYAEFLEYQRRVGAAVAAAPARSTETREASGRVGDASGEKSAQPAAAKDQLKLSQAADTQRGGAAAAAALADDLAAKDKALKEASERVAMLEKNVQEMQKLLELKSNAAAQLQQQAQAAKSVPAQTPPAAAAAAKAQQEEKAAPAVKGVEAAKAPEVAKAPEAAKAEAPKAEASKAAAKAATKVAPKSVPPPAEPSLLDDLLDNIAVVIGGVVAALGLIGYGVFKWRKKKREAQLTSSVLGTPSDANSVLGSEGGRNVDTGSSSLEGDFSQSSAGKSETEEIDPIAEADVYMAYGRDAQAEEILKEALSKDASRQDIRVKLLEIYANRKDRGAFEAVATELRKGTGGQGPEWDKALGLGLSIDPENPLYGGTRAESATQASTTQLISPMPNFGDTVVTQAEPAAPMLDLDLGLGGETSPVASQPDISLDVPAQNDASGISGGLDFDLGLGEDKTSAPSLISTQVMGGDTASQFIGSVPAPEVVVPSLDAGLSIDFNLPDKAETPAVEAPVAAPEVSAPPAAAVSDGIDFDLGMTMESAAPVEEPKAPDMNLSTISLDLGAPAVDGNDSGEAHDARWQEVATKLDLAKAYEEMGDRDGARELLKEVVNEGDGAQQQRAQSMLQALG